MKIMYGKDRFLYNIAPTNALNKRNFYLNKYEEKVVNGPYSSYEEASAENGRYILKSMGIKPKNGGKYLIAKAFQEKNQNNITQSPD